MANFPRRRLSRKRIQKQVGRQDPHEIDHSRIPTKHMRQSVLASCSQENHVHKAAIPNERWPQTHGGGLPAEQIEQKT